MVNEKVYRATLHEQYEGLREAELKCRLTIHRHHATSDLTCPPVFDNVMCWNVTRAGTNASQPCPGYIDNFRINGLAIRRCMENGSWYVNPETNSSWTNFTDCFPDQSKRNSVNNPLNIIQTIQVTGYTISIVSLVLALVILLRYRYSQRSRRTLSKITILHINLFIAYILRASVSLLRNYIFGRAFVLSLNGHLETETDYTQWVCKPITTLFVYALVASTFWLNVEAFVLTKLIVDWKYLQKRNNVFVHVAIGWGGPLFIVVPWLVLRVVTEDDWCWISYTCEWSMWVFVRGPVFISIFINNILFIKIVRFLYKRLKEINKSSHFNKTIILKMARTVCILIPLFGVPDIIFVFLSFWFDVEYLYAEMFFNSLQGCMLSSTFCLTEKKVVQEFWKFIYRCKKTEQNKTGCRRASQPSLSEETTVA